MTDKKKIAAIILAAGGSTRLGEPKQLIEIGGIPLVRRAAMAAIEAGASPIVVVLGAENHQIIPALEGLPDVRIALNSRWETGLASSLAAGLSALGDHPEIDGALIVLADQPFVDAHALKTLVDAFGTDRIVASSVHTRRPANHHPAASTTAAAHAANAIQRAKRLRRGGAGAGGGLDSAC